MIGRRTSDARPKSSHLKVTVAQYNAKMLDFRDHRDLNNTCISARDVQIHAILSFGSVRGEPFAGQTTSKGEHDLSFLILDLWA